MRDLISRQAAIDMLKNRWKKTRNYEGIGDDIAEECELYLKQVPPVTPKQPGWIPVTERLPEDDRDVLVTDSTDCAVAYWRTDAQAWDDSMHGWCDLYGLEVVAWMPLPTPYREGGQDGKN